MWSVRAAEMARSAKTPLAFDEAHWLFTGISQSAQSPEYRHQKHCTGENADLHWIPPPNSTINYVAIWSVKAELRCFPRK